MEKCYVFSIQGVPVICALRSIDQIGCKEMYDSARNEGFVVMPLSEQWLTEIRECLKIRKVSYFSLLLDGSVHLKATIKEVDFI